MTVEHSDIRYQHFHCAETGRLCLTIASKTLESGRIRIAAAIASKRDVPSRAAGRRIAAGRLLSVRSKSLELDLAEFQQMVRDRTIIKLFPHADDYALSAQKFFRILSGK
jgi:hypothetical protein